MLSPFRYHRALSPADAAAHLAIEGAVPLGGGTDLLALIKDRLANPAELVDLRSVPGARGIVERDDGTMVIGGATRVTDLATDERVLRRFPALASACESVGTTAGRHMGTLGGNLCQRPRCWYYRRSVACLKNGGDSCPALTGDNEYHAILGGGPCYMVSYSDPFGLAACKYYEVECWSDQLAAWGGGSGFAGRVLVPAIQTAVSLIGADQVEKDAEGAANGGTGAKIGLAATFILSAVPGGDEVRALKAAASERLLGEAIAGAGARKAIAGAEAKKGIRDVDRLVAQYGGEAKNWAKMVGGSYKAADGTIVQMHWYENVITGFRTEFKQNIR